MANKFFQKQVVTNGTMTGTDAITSDWISLEGLDMISFQAVWTGTPNGAFSFEVTNAPKASGSGVPVASATATALTLPAAFSSGNPAGSASNFVFEFTDMSEAFMRIKYTNASSTGALNVFMMAKGV